MRDGRRERQVAGDRRSRENSEYAREKEQNFGESDSGGWSADLVSKSFSISKPAKINQNNWCRFLRTECLEINVKLKDSINRSDLRNASERLIKPRSGDNM